MIQERGARVPMEELYLEVRGYISSNLIGEREEELGAGAIRFVVGWQYIVGPSIS